MLVAKITFPTPKPLKEKPLKQYVHVYIYKASFEINSQHTTKSQIIVITITKQTNTANKNGTQGEKSIMMILLLACYCYTECMV